MPRLLLLGLCAVLCGSGLDGARAALPMSWSAMESLLQEESTFFESGDPLDVECTTVEDTPLTVDTAVLGEAASLLEMTSPPEHGQVVRAADGRFVYTPVADYSGPDAFELRWLDASGRAVSSRVSVFVEPQNDAPTCVPAFFSATAGEALSVRSPGLLEGSHDADGDALWVSLGTPPAHGELTLEDDGSFTYVPQPGFTGTDTFSLEVSDGAETVSSPVRIAVELPPPVTFFCDPTDDATVSATGANVNYGSESQLRLQEGPAAQRSYLRFSVRGTGERIQRATLRLFCLDSSQDGGQLHAVANEFRGTRSPWDERRLSWNNAPALEGMPYLRLGAVAAGTWLEIDVTDLVRGEGDVSFALENRSRDGVRYSSKEGLHPPQLEIVSIVPRETENQAPVAMDDAYEVTEDMTLEVYGPGLLENDTDEDGDYLYLVSRSQPAHGILVADAEGGFIYQPHPDYHGPDSFTYVASDLRGGMDTRTVAITVLPEADAPVAKEDSWLLLSTQTFHVAAPGVLNNDSDADEERLTAELLTGVSHGTLVLSDDGSFTYTPHEGYRGTDSFLYRASDGAWASHPVVVSLHVEATAGKATETREPVFATSLDRVFPNPFGSGTWIEYRLGQSGRVEAELYDVRGLRVRLLTSAEQGPGERSLYWNGFDDRGIPLPTGIYFLRLRLGDELRTRKLVLQR